MKPKTKTWPFWGVIFLCLVLSSSAALACGTIRMWIAGLDPNRSAARVDPMECASSYRPPADDIAMLKAMRRFHSPRMDVFINFNHLWGARNEPGYKEFVKRLPSYAKPGLAASHNPQRKKAGPGHELTTFDQLAEHYKNWMVVSDKMGANLRSRASLKSKVIASMRFGLTVERIGAEGDWLKVKCVGPGSVDPQYERQAGYVHKSLVKPY